MISEEHLPELARYRRLEKRLPFTNDGSWGRLVTANGNEQIPVHRWFRFKESFAADLLRAVVELLSPKLGRRFDLLDPFCGVGTALVASQELRAIGFEVTARGVEQNPFAAFVARTKTRWPEFRKERIADASEWVLESSRQINVSRIPTLSSLTSGRCMTRYMARRLLSIRTAIEKVSDEATRDALLLGLASSIESVSKTRKDGRALRLVGKTPVHLNSLLKRRWSEIGADTAFFQELLPASSIPQVLRGDGRMLSDCGVNDESVDLILTSPPYPNNIDYSEVYKLELWLMGFINDGAEFLRLRKSTFRSHPTASVPEPSREFLQHLEHGRLEKLLNPLTQRARGSRQRWRERLVTGYFSDLWASLESHYRCLRPGGFEVLVVGNSLHGRAGEAYLIPTDIGVAEIAACVGFHVERIVAARHLMRRLAGNHFLRESVVVLKKP